MKAFLITISITLAQIPAVLLRYMPFSKIVTKQQKKTLLLLYTICFTLLNIIIFMITSNLNTNINPLLYKTIFFLGGVTYFCINCVIIKKMFFQHIFVFGMQGSYSLLLHSLVAIVLGLYGQSIEPYIQIVIQSFTYIILFILTTYPLWILMKDSFILNISTEHNYYWNIVWLIPTLLCLGNVIATMDGNWINTWQQLVTRLLMGVAIFVLWKCINLDFKELDEKLALKSTNKLLYIQLAAINQQAQTINENDEKISIIRHDMRHNVQILSSLIQNREIDAALVILKQLNNNLESTMPVIFCKNPVINSSLLVYINRAQKENIKIISEIDIPQDIPWNSNDIAILFANALENAINASVHQQEEKKEMQIFTKYADKKLAIVIKNRFDRKVSFVNNNIPVSKEADHGVGMSSISTIVSKYHGHMVCSQEKGWFTISIMFSENFID